MAAQIGEEYDDVMMSCHVTIGFLNISCVCILSDHR